MVIDLDDEFIGDGETIYEGNSLKETMEKSIHRFLETPEEIHSNLKTLKAEFAYLRQ